MENQTKYIRVCELEGQVSVDVPVELDGSLSAATLRAYFPGVTGLKFRPGKSSPYRTLELHGDSKFRAPGGSWCGCEFVCVTSGGQKRKREDNETIGIHQKFKESRRDIGDTFGIHETDPCTLYSPDSANELIGKSIQVFEPIELEEDDYTSIFHASIHEPSNEQVLKDIVCHFFSNDMFAQSQDDLSTIITKTASNPEDFPDAAFDYSAMRNFMKSYSDKYDNPVTDVPTFCLTDGVYEVIGKDIQPIQSYMPDLESTRYKDVTLLQKPANEQVLRDINEQSQEGMTNASNREYIPDSADYKGALRSFIESYLDVNEFFDDPETEMPTIDTTDNADQTDSAIQLGQQTMNHSGTPEFEDDINKDMFIEVKHAPLNRDV